MFAKTTITATVVGGQLKPDQPIERPEGSKVTLDLLSPDEELRRLQRRKKAEEFIAFCESIAFRSGEERFRREDLYDDN